MKPTPQQLKLIKEMAKETSAMIKYVGLDALSDGPYLDLEEILNSFEDQDRATTLRKQFDKMPYRAVSDMVGKVNDLLSTGKYD